MQGNFTEFTITRLTPRTNPEIYALRLKLIQELFGGQDPNQSRGDSVDDTTSATISGGMKALLEHPDQLEKLRDNPELGKQAAREMIRWVSPVRHMMRTTTEDVEFRGKILKAGDNLCLWYPSANRDSDAIDDPDTFNIERDNRDQLAFGYGGHMCLGQHLALLEVEMFFRELLPRLDRIEMISQPEWVQAVFVGGLKSMPVKYSFT